MPPPSSKRYAIVAITAVAAMWMYIDRVCFSTLTGPIQEDLKISDDDMSYILGAFFATYAIFQIPMGSLADRFGARKVLALSIAGWSVVTAATGFAGGFLSLLGIRLLLGISEAGAYPAAAGLVKRWARPTERGRFSSIVALGGRIGGALAPLLTAFMAVALVSVVIGGWEVGPSGKNWRGVFVLYGTCGLIVALLFWFIVRDHPPGGVDLGTKAEQTPQQPQPLEKPEKSEGEAIVTSAPQTYFQRLAVIALTRRMWFFGTLQFCNNISWVFLITLLPKYMMEARGVAFETMGNIQTLVLCVGCAGMVLGGVLTDVLNRKLGSRWGRAVPAMTVMTGCSMMCLLLSTSPVLWLTIVALAVMAFCQDLGIPSIWAYAQDVGGKNVGVILGFGNMLGNLGAALSPWILNKIKSEFGWSAAFGLCAAAYMVSIACAYTLDASRPITKED